MRTESALDLDGRTHASAWRGEHCEEAVPLSVDLFPIVLFETRPDERVVIGKSCGVIVLAEATEQFGRAFDVGE